MSDELKRLAVAKDCTADTLKLVHRYGYIAVLGVIAADVRDRIAGDHEIHREWLPFAEALELARTLADLIKTKFRLQEELRIERGQRIEEEERQ